MLAAFSRLGGNATETAAPKARRIAFLSDSGTSFNRTLEMAVESHCRGNGGVECPFTGVTTAKVDPIKFANPIERTAEEAEALVIVAREDLMINRAIRAVMARKVPVVCLTTDLPASGRTAYVGSDQTGAGATAAYLMGQAVGNLDGKILLVYSAPYRSQEERELGFRRVLRSEFPRLEVDERVNSNDDTDYVYRNVVRYIEDHGAPAGIYNVAAGNIGIGRALGDFNLQGKVVFIGHELNFNSRMLLETGVMNFVIGHDVAAEVAHAIDFVTALLDKRPLPALGHTRVRIYTKYSRN
ncbi:MAG: substrate-binding domain-containing protein [Rhizobiales bacterium]|nr:substrate-binding domain-containing protein [Hyphomicrobiales bacterium]